MRMHLSAILFLRYILLALSCFLLQAAYATPAMLSLELKNIDLADTIRLLAKFLHKPCLISAAIHGRVTLSLQQANPDQVLDSLLVSHGLGKIKIGNIWWIAPQEELIKEEEVAFKWQTLLEKTTNLKTKVWQINYAKAEEIRQMLQDERAAFLSKRGHVRVDARTNTLCVQDTAAQLQVVDGLVKRLDVPVPQVLIEARLASIDMSCERELGIAFTVKSPNGVAASSSQYSLVVAKLANGSLLDVKLAALENAGFARLIASPRLFAANQQLASIEAGEEVPYQETSESGGTAVVFKKAVLGLKVIPQVLPNKVVSLQLQISQDRPSNQLILGMPTISTRQMVTNVLVKDGQTIILGGIYEKDDEKGEVRLPFLSKLPVIGVLFKQQQSQESKRELLIFITPKIIVQKS